VYPPRERDDRRSALRDASAVASNDVGFSNPRPADAPLRFFFVAAPPPPPPSGAGAGADFSSSRSSSSSFSAVRSPSPASAAATRFSSPSAVSAALDAPPPVAAEGAARGSLGSNARAV
jgi:hypothetical protein